MAIKRWVIVLGIAALLGAACGGDDSGGNGGSSAGGGGGGGGGGGSVQLTAANFTFDPTDLSASTGDTIEVSNEDDTEHNFTAEDADIDEDIDPGDSITISLSDVDPGSYDFHCEYHPDTMKGTLKVSG